MLDDSLRAGATGDVYGDNRFSDGKRIYTSGIEWKDDHHIRTMNTNYILGKPYISSDNNVQSRE